MAMIRSCRDCRYFAGNNYCSKKTRKVLSTAEAQLCSFYDVVGQVTISNLENIAGQLADYQIPDSIITTTKIANEAVATAKIAASAITNAKIADGAVSGAKIADGTILRVDLEDYIVNNSKVALDAAILESKLALDHATDDLNDAILLRQELSEKDEANGYLGLDASAKVPLSKLNPLTNSEIDAAAAIVETKLALDHATDDLNDAILPRVLQTDFDAWLDQSVKQAASPTFDDLTLTGDLKVDNKLHSTGNYLGVDLPDVSTEDSYIKFFRSTNTTGNCRIEICAGDGTNSIVHQFFKNGDAIHAGDLTVSGGRATVIGSNSILYLENDNRQWRLISDDSPDQFRFVDGTDSLNIFTISGGGQQVDFDGAITVGGDLTAANIITAGLVDGIDLSTFKSDYDSKINQAVKTTSSPTFAGADLDGNPLNKVTEVKPATGYSNSGALVQFNGTGSGAELRLYAGENSNGIEFRSMAGSGDTSTLIGKITPDGDLSIGRDLISHLQLASNKYLIFKSSIVPIRIGTTDDVMILDETENDSVADCEVSSVSLHRMYYDEISVGSTILNKQNIEAEDIETLAAQLDGVKVKSFEMKKQPDKRRIGFIAEDLPSICKTANADGSITGYNPDALLALLFAKVQSLEKQLQEVKHAA